MIYHIATETDWAAAKKNGFYAPAAFTREGFIHACTMPQMEGVLQRHFQNVKNLLVLHLDERRLTAPHAYVFVPVVNDEFPHIFGNINLDAVTEVTMLKNEA